MRLDEYFRKQGIEEDLCQKLIPLFKFKEYHPGDIILHMGENTKVLCLMLQGIVRGYFLDEDGNDITKCFSKEGNWCCVYNYIQNEPSQYYIEALENCYVAQIDVDNVRTLIQEYPMIRKVYESLYQEAFILLEQKGISFQRMSGKERCLWFSKNNLDIIKRVKQEYIASYLGLTPSSLSRIKRGL